MLSIVIRSRSNVFSCVYMLMINRAETQSSAAYHIQFENNNAHILQ